MIVDAVRSCAVYRVHPWVDSDLTTEIETYFVPPETPALPFAHVYGTSDWLHDDFEREVAPGQVGLEKRGEYRKGKLPPIGPLPGNHFCGPQAAWEGTARLADAPPLRWQSAGVSICCKRVKILALGIGTHLDVFGGTSIGDDPPMSVDLFLVKDGLQWLARRCLLDPEDTGTGADLKIGLSSFPNTPGVLTTLADIPGISFPGYFPLPLGSGDVWEWSLHDLWWRAHLGNFNWNQTADAAPVPVRNVFLYDDGDDVLIAIGALLPGKTFEHAGDFLNLDVFAFVKQFDPSA